MQHALKSACRAAGAWIVTSELLLQQLIAMNDADAAFDLRLGRVSLPAFAHRLEKNDCSLKLRLDMVHLAFLYSCHDVE